MNNMQTSMLISATYDGPQKRVLLKFYNPETQKLELQYDQTEHKPYCYSRLAPSDLAALEDRGDIIDIKSVTRHDNIIDKDVVITKIVAADPLTIGGTQTDKSIRNTMETWESDIKYYENYIYDNQLVVGAYYSYKDNKIIPQKLEIPSSVLTALKTLLLDHDTSKGVIDPVEYQKYVAEWADTLNQPIPKMRRLSFDIEVDSEKNRIPDPHIAERRITAVGFEGTDDVHEVYVLGKPSAEKPGTVAKITYYNDEKTMIIDAIAKIRSYPIILTYNGDDFDMPYMHNRAAKLGIKNSPFYMMRDSATLKEGVHIDLYRTFSNRAFQIYAFSNKYTEFSLNSVSKAILGEEKIDYGIPLDDLTADQLATYCYNDARLTYNLTSFGDDLLMNLLVVISRIAKMSIDDIARLGVSQWIRSLLYYEHRRHNILIPKREELESKSTAATTDATIKDKKYRGGLVVDPKAGVHFDVTVMDFASLYPSIIKVQNLSYETVRCPHDECKSNTIPDTTHWVCQKKNGMTSLLIGSLRDLRVNYYKALSRDTTLGEIAQQQYSIVSQALKIILNASYGVMGAEMFPLYYLPAAEATTAVGRHIITDTIAKCESSGIQILYGDTDSIFIKNPTSENIAQIIEYAKNSHGVELEVDKEYRYVVLSDRKKNYFGVTKSGKVDIKGLTGKKSHTPPFIRNLFYRMTEILSEVSNEADFERIKTKISNEMSACVNNLRSHKIPLHDLAFNVMLSKSPAEYTKTIPQHIKAAKQLEQVAVGGGNIGSYSGSSESTPQRIIKKGDIISYVKTITAPGVKPIEIAKINEIDIEKYLETIDSTLDQIISVIGMDFDQIIGNKKQVGLDDFWK